MGQRFKSVLLVGLLFFGYLLQGSAQDTLLSIKDSLRQVPHPVKVNLLDSALQKNVFYNSSLKPVAQVIKPRSAFNVDIYFYLLLAIVLFFGIARAAYSKYFSNLFRVFFNSSLRQSQLADQLVQDQLPSLIFNVIFVISTGFYFYFLLRYLGMISYTTNLKLLSLCIAGTAAVYFVKYVTLKFTGWITGFRQEADIYTFIVFLINKIVGIFLLPVVVILAFSGRGIANIAIIISFIILSLLVMMRFFRAFSLLQSKIRVSRFHFLLYIFSLEVLPLFIIYKGVMFYFDRNL